MSECKHEFAKFVVGKAKDEGLEKVSYRNICWKCGMTEKEIELITEMVCKDKYTDLVVDRLHETEAQETLMKSWIDEMFPKRYSNNVNNNQVCVHCGQFINTPHLENRCPRFFVEEMNRK